MSIVVLNGRTFTLGSILTLNENATSTCNNAPAGLKVIITKVQNDGSDSPLVGISCSDVYQEGWGNLDGVVEDGRGWWIHANLLEKSILEGGDRYEISDVVNFKGQDLKGKSCNILASFDNGMVFVEMSVVVVLMGLANLAIVLL